MALSKLNGTQLSKLMADMPKNMFTQKRKAGMITTLALNILVSVYTRNNWPQVVCLTQMEEKARQIGAAIEKISKYMDMEELKVIYAVRGNKPAKGLKVEHHIIIGTPGEVLDWYKKFLLFNITLINLFVLAEADLIIATQGYLYQCLRLYRRLSNTCQVMLTSETTNDSFKEFAKKIVSDPVLSFWMLPLFQWYNQVPIGFYVMCNQKNIETWCEIYWAIMLHCQGRKSDSNTASDITRSPADGIAGGVAEWTREPNNDDMQQWTVDEVSQFIQSLKGCEKYAQTFQDEKIDGSILPSLTEEHLMQKLGIKLGPAIKILMSVMKRRPCPWDPSQPNS